jgi:hypothetical protein
MTTAAIVAMMSLVAAMIVVATVVVRTVFLTAAVAAALISSATTASASTATAQTAANFLAACGTTFRFREPFFFEEQLLSGIEDELVAAVFANQQFIAGFELRSGGR